MISKELLSEVLKEKVLFIGSINKSILNYEVYSDFTCDKVAYGEINIYELVHMCREWLLHYEKNMISIAIELRNNYWTIFIYENSIMIEKAFQNSSEHEAIFKACEWILENK